MYGWLYFKIEFHKNKTRTKALGSLTKPKCKRVNHTKHVFVTGSDLASQNSTLSVQEYTQCLGIKSVEGCSWIRWRGWNIIDINILYT